jgi:DNA mismatch endonuclease (patch repair protein)
MDTLTRKERSRIMSLVKSKDTRPELFVRRLVHGLGYRYRLHVRHLPGCPDLVFSPRRKVIFVSGCFWHRHACPNGRRLPKSRVAFWRTKLEGNKTRDQKKRRELAKLGWKALVVWECQTSLPHELAEKIVRFLDS